jgi:hypothetical protein
MYGKYLEYTSLRGAAFATKQSAAQKDRLLCPDGVRNHVKKCRVLIYDNDISGK